MIESVENQVSYIIGYRQSSADRLTGIQFVLWWLNHRFPELEIILVEQDDDPVLDINLPPNCRKYFVYNPGLYNRCWAFNVGVKYATKEILVFADSDMFMSKEDYLKTFSACSHFEAVNPNGNRVTNVGEVNCETLKYIELENRRLWTFAAGIMAMHRSSYEKIGGWDERYEGWGVEDDAISHIIKNHLSNATLNCRMYHIDHARSTYDSNTQPNYNLNRKIFDELSTLHGESLLRYISSRKDLPIGDPLKYLSQGVRTSNRPERFILLVLTAGSPVNIRELLQSWRFNYSKKADWTIIVSDDGTSEGIQEYLESQIPQDIRKIILNHHGKDHIYRFNSSLRELSGISFDLCFYCNVNIRFTKPGWDLMYYQVVKRTGLGHVCFFDGKYSEFKALSTPLIRGELVSYAPALNVQSNFFTIVPEMIREVGYLDPNIMGKGSLEFLDYSLRCFRKGFNILRHPFDVKGGADYISVITPGSPYIDTEFVRLTSPGESENRKRWLIIQQARIYIPFNELIPFETTEILWERGINPGNDAKIAKDNHQCVEIGKPPVFSDEDIARITHKRAYYRADLKDAALKSSSALFLYSARRIYNLIYRFKWFGVIRTMDRFSNFLIKCGMAIKNLDR
jgi:glycosyltransferase involved in cell wall biosynthesis